MNRLIIEQKVAEIYDNSGMSTGEKMASLDRLYQAAKKQFEQLEKEFSQQQSRQPN